MWSVLSEGLHFSILCLRLTSLLPSSSPVIFHVYHKLRFTYLNDSFNPSGSYLSVFMCVCLSVCLSALLPCGKMRTCLIKSPERSVNVWHVLVKTSPSVYRGASCPLCKSDAYLAVNVIRCVCLLAAADASVKIGTTRWHLLMASWLYLSQVVWCVCSLFPKQAEPPLFTCWDSLLLVSSQGVSCLLFYDFLITSHGSL